MDWITWIYQGLLYISNFEVLGNNSNILGVFWLLALIWVAYSRFEPQFDQLLPNKSRKRLWQLALLITCFTVVFLMQMMLDDFITTPIDLVFGSWSMRAAQFGAFSLSNLLATKWDVYSMILMYLLILTAIGVWRFFHFTWKSALLLGVTICWVVFIAQFHVWSHLRYEGWMRVEVFWLTYPEYRVLTGFFVSSLLKKPTLNSNRVDLRQHSSKLLMALLAIAFQFAVFSPFFVNEKLMGFWDIAPVIILGESALIMVLFLLRKWRLKT